MIPQTLTATEAQRLLTLGRARLVEPVWLTTARAVYAWDDATQRYARAAGIVPVVPAGARPPIAPPRPVPAGRAIAMPAHPRGTRRVPLWVIALAVLSGPIGLPLLLVYVLVRGRDCHACGDHDETVHTPDVPWSWRAYR
jgi:hypothetical protein